MEGGSGRDEGNEGRIGMCREGVGGRAVGGTRVGGDWKQRDWRMNEVQACTPGP